MAQTRVLGQRAVGMCGPDAARFFYDEDHVRRHTAIPWPVQNTLFGRGYTLDGAGHRRRKDIFLTAVTNETAETLAGRVAAAWDEAVASWQPGRPVRLFDEAAKVITKGVCRWAGVPLADVDIPAVARDLVAMVAASRHRDPALARADGSRPQGGMAGPAGHQCARWRGPRARGFRARRRQPPPRGRRRGAVASAGGGRAAERHPPTVATCWFVAYAGHALHRWPQHRQRLRSEHTAFAESFAHELRRFYPFAPFLGGRAVRDLTWCGEHIPKHAMVLLDLWGHNHDEQLWGDPYAFRPERFLNHEIGPFELVPQGAGDPHTNHRCPGEPATVTVLCTLAVRLARLDYEVPEQDLTISLHRIPARVRSGFVFAPTGDA